MLGTRLSETRVYQEAKALEEGQDVAQQTIANNSKPSSAILPQTNRTTLIFKCSVQDILAPSFYCQTQGRSKFTICSPTPVADAGFWPVTSRSFTTTCT